MNVVVSRVSARTRSSCFVTGSEDQGGTHNVVVTDYHCRESAGGIVLKDEGTMFHNPPKSNFSFHNITMHNMSIYFHGKEQLGSAFSIHGVHNMSLSHVVGTLVPQAGEINVVSDLRIDHLHLENGDGKPIGGFSCGSNVSGTVADPATVSPIPAAKHGCK